ncbi:MAG TPA: RtcB family protein [Methylomirabilota bacterium]|jgi:tRNA-splicing ligase RtcB
MSDPSGVPIRVWEPTGHPLEPLVMQQARHVAGLPITEAVCLMPDAHFGIGGPVGGVIATRGAVVPALVGVDIGCGMIAARTDVAASELEGRHAAVRAAIEAAVPVGGPGVKGSWEERRGTPPTVEREWDTLSRRFEAIVGKHPRIKASPARTQLGTLGGGNHFIEVCLDEGRAVWLMVHSGSRGVGNRIGVYFSQRARDQSRVLKRRLPDEALAWLDEGTALFDDYADGVAWAQDFARANRRLMLDAVVAAVAAAVGRPVALGAGTVDCHHNYVEPRGQSRGAGGYVTRKGAVSARAGEPGIIPGSMGARSFIVRGRGNAASYESCSHGAGRRMSRGEARRVFSLEDHARATAGIECRKDAGVLDETPGAYKDIDAVIAAQSDLVEVVTALRQVVTVKG